MKLDNISFNEVEAFFNSLGIEKELLGIPLKYVLSSNFITGVGVNEELAGIAGIIKSYAVIPSCYFVVKSKFQGRGLANTLVQTILKKAKSQYSFLVLSAHETKDFKSAFHLYNKYGFRIFYREGPDCWMCLPFDRKGNLICTALPLIYFVFRRVNRLKAISYLLSRSYTFFLKFQYIINRPGK